MIRIAKELTSIAKSLMASDGLNGMSNVEARKFVNALLQKHTRGFFNDEYWQPITKTFRELDAHAIDYSIDKTEYSKNADGAPDSKTWSVTANFVNNKGRETTIYIHIVASGAGSVSDPLSRYDVVAYAN